MKYIESPHKYENKPGKASVFLAGGITGCPDWQQEVTVFFQPTNIVILNPRRKHFPINTPDAASEQINWEFEHLRKADVILFWFPKESICPIALYELGAWTRTEKHIFIGMHPGYERRQDIEIQTRLRRPGSRIVYSLQELVNQIIDYLANKNAEI